MIVNLYTTTLNSVAEPTIILLVISLFLMLALYISYVYYSRVNKPIYVSKINFAAYENQSQLNQPLLTTGTTSTTGSNISNVKPTTSTGKRVEPKVDINQLQEFSNLQACPQGDCAIRITGNLLGVKRCPAESNGVIMYDTTQEQCVQSNLCPSSIPYAEKLNGEALNGVCEVDGCNCLVLPQCATYVTKYFNNIGSLSSGQGSQGLNYAFSIAGQKTNNNFYNPLQISIDQLGKTFCKINPAFVDTIINGCELTNHWTDPTNCTTYENVIFNTNIKLTITVQNPNDVYKYFNSSTIPKNISASDYYANSNNLVVIVSGLEIEPPQYLPNIGYFFDSNNTSTVFRYTGYEQATVNLNTGVNFYILKNVNHYDKTQKMFLPGVNGLISVGDNLSFEYFDFTFCNDSAVNGANNKSMLMCVQDYNQPCTEGTLAYNIDTINNPRNFCQTYAENRLSISSIQTFYLTDPAYFTQSCVIGLGCGVKIDYTQCNQDTFDCTKAIQEKKNRFFPIFDDSAVSNVWEISPNYVQLDNFGTSIVSNNGSFSLNNNLFNLQDGDYYQINNAPINDIFLMKSAAVGDTVLYLNTANGLQVGDTLLNPIGSVVINSINVNQITISASITSSVVDLFKSGTHLLFSSVLGDQEYGLIKTGVNNSFNFLNLSTNDIQQNVDIDVISNQGIFFYKQFGFNGLNYGTCFNINTFEREYSKNYKYGINNNLINSALRLADTPPFIVDNIISNFADNTVGFVEQTQQVFNSTTANFKQKNSMYYPIWNENTYKQECVFCSPSLYALPVINTAEKVVAVDIQFSGKVFYQYIKDIDSHIISGKNNIEYYLYTLFALTSGKNNQVSTTSTIYLQNPNTNISVGDYVIDASGILPVIVYDNTGAKYSGSTANFQIYEDMFSSILDNGKPALLPNHLTSYVYNNITLTANVGGNSQNNKNLFAGKLYYNTNNTSNYYVIVPTIKVLSITQNNTVLTLSSSKNLSLPKNTLLQFIKPNEILSIGLEGDIDAINQTTSYAGQPVYSGSGAVLNVAEITDGRIVDINVINQGSNYVITNKPLLYVNQYKNVGGVVVL